MSIQSEIDYQMSKEGGSQYHILVKNEKGPVTLPRGVSVSLYDCIVEKFDATKGENSVFLGGKKTKVLGEYRQYNGNLTVENTEFIGEVFWKDRMRVKMVKDSIFLFRVNVIENSYVDMYNCSWDGYGSYALYVLDHSRATVSNSILKKREKGAWAKMGSFIDLTDCTLGVEIGLKLEDNSQINMIGGQNKATKIGIQAEGKCQVYLSKVQPITTPSEFDVQMSDWCKLTSHGTDMQNAKVAIEAKKFCTIECMDFNFIKSIADDCIRLEDNTTARFIAGYDIIQSMAKVAISMKDHCTVNCIDVKTIESLADHAVKLNANNCKFEATGQGDGQIKGMLCGINATDKCSASVDNYALVKGEAEEGIYLQGDSHGYFSKVRKLTSIGADAAFLEEESDISFQDHLLISSVAGNGITAINNCTVNLQTVQKCEGIAGHGIYVQDNTELDIIYTEMIEGKAGLGVVGMNNCDIYINRSNVVKGALGGIKNSNSGRLEVELLKSVTPDSGIGIETVNEVDTRLNMINVVTHGTSHTNCDIQMKDCKAVSNLEGVGIRVTGGEVVIKKVNASGIGASVMLNGTYAKASNTNLNQTLQSSGSEIELNGVTLNGQLVSTGDTITLNKGAVNGTISGTGSDINIQLTAVSGAINIDGGTLDLESAACGTAIVVAGAQLRALLATVPNITLTGSAAQLMGGAYGTVTTDILSTVIAQRAACTFTGVGSVISMESGPLIPGMNGLSMIGPQVKMQDKTGANVEIIANAINVNAIVAGGIVTIDGVQVIVP